MVSDILLPTFQPCMLIVYVTVLPTFPCCVLTSEFIPGWRETLFALPRRLFGGAGASSGEGDLSGADGQVGATSPN
jgi:hypothetical protein